MKHSYVIGNIYGIRKLNKLYYKNGIRMSNSTCIICGKEKEMKPYELYNIKQNSCMCQNIVHNMYNTKLYGVYANMKYRCYNSNHKEFKNYGGKGVLVCEEWLNNFINFYDWALNNGYTSGLTIDRVNNNGNYEPDNCRWITKSLNTTYANKTSQHRKSNNGTYYGRSPDGEYFEFENANEFSKLHNLNAGCVRQVANNNKRSHKGWTFGFINDNNK